MKKRIMATIVLACISALGCEGPFEHDASGGETTHPIEPEMREWRIVFFFLDDNELADQAENDIEAILSVADPYAHTHRIFLRDSTYDGAVVTIATGSGSREVPLPGLPAGSLLDRDTGRTIIEVLNTEFPARKHALFIVGHGRGWRGIGYNSAAEKKLLAARDLRTLSLAGAAGIPKREDDPPSDHPNVIVFDAGWAAFAELIFELRSVAVNIVAPTFNLHRAGIDYRLLMEAFREGDWTLETVLERSREALERAGEGGPALVLRRSDLEGLEHYLNVIIQDASIADTSALAQEELRSQLMEDATAASVPGDTHIRLGALRANLPDANVELNNLLLHLVTVDELGLPAGHATAYRADASPPGSVVPSFFQDTLWAPDFFNRRGFLYELWYREY